MEPDPKVIGGAIKKYRLKLGLTQNQLAERAGLDTVYVSQLETGHRLPSLAALYRLAESLGTPPGSLLDFEAGEDVDPLAVELNGLLVRLETKTRHLVVDTLRALIER